MFALTNLVKPFVEDLGSGYFIPAGVILFMGGLPWLFIRTRISNPDLRRFFSSLLFALAFIPSFIPVHNSTVSVPAILMVKAIFPNPAAGLVIGIIMLVWGVIFMVRSFTAICYIWIKKKISKPC
jgi:hypothetical protein